MRPSKSVQETIKRLSDEAYQEMYGYSPDEIPPEVISAMQQFLDHGDLDDDTANARYHEAARLASQIVRERKSEGKDDEIKPRKKFLGIF